MPKSLVFRLPPLQDWCLIQILLLVLVSRLRLQYGLNEADSEGSLVLVPLYLKIGRRPVTLLSMAFVSALINY